MQLCTLCESYYRLLVRYEATARPQWDGYLKCAQLTPDPGPSLGPHTATRGNTHTASYSHHTAGIGHSDGGTHGKYAIHGKLSKRRSAGSSEGTGLGLWLHCGSYTQQSNHVHNLLLFILGSAGPCVVYCVLCMLVWLSWPKVELWCGQRGKI